jgi:hypothetical protein
MSDLNFRNGKRVFSSQFGDFYYSTGQRAFSAQFGDIYYRNGNRAYSCQMDKAYYEDGKTLGTGDGVRFSAEGVDMNLGPKVDSFRCDLGEGLSVHIQVGHKPNFKKAQLYGANGGVIFEKNF